MDTRALARFYLWLVLTLLAAVLAARTLPGVSDTRAQSPLPTETYTPTPSPQTPTDTPTPSAPTDTPVPPTPTNTPAPPTSTLTPIPLPPTLGSILIEPPDGVAALDTEIVVSAILTMPNLVHLEAAMWDWGDGSISSCAPDSADCTVEPEDGMQSTDFIVGRVAGSHTYSQPGFYAVHLTVRDIFGQFDTATFEYLVVYDPDGGFVTGGGWIDSPADWCPFSDELCHQAEGKSTFSFTAEYKQGATVPTGNTQFQLNAGDLSFHWGSYHWLVVDAGGSLAVLRGFGRLNGELSPDGDPYMFRLSVGDGSPDTFSVSIEDHYVHFGWYYDFEAEIWREGWHGHTDTVYRQPYGTLLPQPIGGSSIVVHAAKDK